MKETIVECLHCIGPAKKVIHEWYQLVKINHILYSLNLGHVEAAKILIENNAEIDARDNYFNTPLHIACSHGR